MKVGDLVRTARTAGKGLGYGIGVIIQIETMPTDQTAVIPRPRQKTYLVSWVSKGFRQWRGHNELRRLQ